MQKKKMIFAISILGIVLSSFLFYDKYFPTNIFHHITNGDRFLIWALTTIFIIYYIQLDSNPQLAPLALSNEKDGAKENDKPNTSFRDVAGLEEIKEELQETIDFINNSQKYTKMGAKIPKGILFYGPPGTGKTLLAKAVAGETDSTFLYASGSEFVEKYVGVGAKRVRTLFEKAKKEAPSIIFIDEIDAIGAKRNLDSNNEKDQTLNQLLAEMDGFNTSETVVIIGATNRLDLLDEALLRPGRFDRHIYVGNPNIKAREKILEVHTTNKPLCKDISIHEIANKTHGLSGAELANIANEAAIIAVRKNKNKIDKDDFNEAIERVLAGLEVKNPSILLKEKKTVAIHESGHALVSKILKTDMVQKISIIPRGQALGYVLKFPEEERYLMTKKELMSKITGLVAGRAAEQIVFGEITTGAKDDLTKATQIAQEMVCSYGMSSLGNISIDEYYVKNSFNIIREEMRKIIDECYENAIKIIEDNKIILFHIADLLMKQESITSEELDEIFKQYESNANCAT
ncbi:ATP-dependent metallopeptidase FtsH/Yme1/Tma family protein [Sporanaerobacter acetigenes]|uniref:ATP-dependent zinc metalloprotease FtsH n=1 Tax=Sporanaerobacter acetigenes DSM 13106 TaxID=1123281 RepID=A0A1M5WUM8_9FIRM|nr:AAA family ATPase [Sporanaerobacter acetigenes]SHH91150.1 cell division protease FtsH [Sporanaerobacter acetigenes DSM 13106]